MPKVILIHETRKQIVCSAFNLIIQHETMVRFYDSMFQRLQWPGRVKIMTDARTQNYDCVGAPVGATQGQTKEEVYGLCGGGWEQDGKD